jgi:hypothetical protein
MATRELRAFHDYEIRAADDGKRIFDGHAAVWDTQADIGGMFLESVAKGAFKKTLRESDVPFVFNHDDATVMARTSANNLRLSEDDSGLYVEATLDERDDDVRQLVTKIENGNVSGMSFAFRAIKDDWDEAPDPPERILREVELFDVSPVTQPAYAGTDASIRAELRALMAEHGITLHDPDEDPGAEPEPTTELVSAGHSLETLRMRLVIARNRMPLLGLSQKAS